MFRATIGKVARFIDASPEFPKEVLNAGPGDIFHKAAADVDSGDTELEPDKTVQITEGTWFVSTTSAEGVFRELKVGRFEDATIADDLTVGGDAEINGALNHDGTKVGFTGSTPIVPPEVKKAELTAGELAEALEELGLVTIEA